MLAGLTLKWDYGVGGSHGGPHSHPHSKSNPVVFPPSTARFLVYFPLTPLPWYWVRNCGRQICIKSPVFFSWRAPEGHRDTVTSTAKHEHGQRRPGGRDSKRTMVRIELQSVSTDFCTGCSGAKHYLLVRRTVQSPSQGQDRV
ncbi:hypothetical protein CaCOL14_008588 [Colletotrichum acutatum]